MARPSIREERREQILDAFENCIVQFGIDGATLERISEEAGLARPLIRHNIGNREELLDALVTRFIERSTKSLEMTISALPENYGTITLIEWLFEPGQTDQRYILVSGALIMAAANDKNLAQKMRKWIRSFIKDFETLIARDWPNCPEEQLKATAIGLAAIYFNAESLSPLGLMSDVQQGSKHAALQLLQPLNDL